MTTIKSNAAYHAMQCELADLFGFAQPTTPRTECPDWYGLRQPLTDKDLDAIEARAHAATPGPWKWTQAIANRYLTVAHPRSRKRFVYLLQGRPPGPWADYLDKDILSLNWLDLKRTVYWGGPGPDDQEFIAHARVDIERLLAEVRALRAKLNP